MVGILLIINPVGFTTAIIVILGVLLILSGVGSVIGYFRENPENAAQDNGLARGLLYVSGGCVCVFKTEWFFALLSAVMSMVFSVLILANPFSSATVLWTFIAVSLIIEAVMDILTFIFGKK